MVGRSCCVVDCHSRSHDYKGRKLNNELRNFFCIPAVKAGEGHLVQEVTTRRRRAWVAAIRRTTISFETKTQTTYVCSLHFHSGKPAYEMYEAHPDWVPSLRMGHQEQKVTNTNRYNRQQKREKRLREAEQKQQERAQRDEEYSTQTEVEESAKEDEDNTAAVLEELGTATYQQMEADSENAITDECAFCTKRQTEINRLLAENRELKEELEKKNFTEEFLKNDDAKVKYYTGLPSFSMFWVLFTHLLPFMPKTGRRVLSAFQMLLVTFMRLRLDLPIQHIAHVFGVSRTTIGHVFSDTISVMYARLSRLVYWPDRDSLRTSMPHQFAEAFGTRVAVIIDCFEIFTEKPSNLKARAQTFSFYKHHHTQKYLVGVTPQGAISFISKGWGGRTSDKHVTENCGFLDNLLPGDLVLADRGFDIKETVGLMCAEVKIPAFTKGHAQMDAKDVEDTRELAHLRIHVERVIGNLCNKYEILTGTVPITMVLPCEGEDVTFLDKVVKVCCALTNMCPSVV